MEISPTQVSYRSSDMHGLYAELTTYCFFTSINPECVNRDTMALFTIPIMFIIWISGVLGLSVSKGEFVTHFHTHPRVLEKTSEVGGDTFGMVGHFVERRFGWYDHRVIS